MLESKATTIDARLSIIWVKADDGDKTNSSFCKSHFTVQNMSISDKESTLAPAINLIKLSNQDRKTVEPKLLLWLPPEVSL